MPRMCAIFGCFNKYKKNSDIRFFRFPKNEHYNKLWKSSCKRGNVVNTEHLVVCSIHFTRYDYIDDKKYRLLGIDSPRNKRLLKEDAVPSLMLLNEGKAVSPSKVAQSKGREDRAEKRGMKRDVREILEQSATTQSDFSNDGQEGQCSTSQDTALNLLENISLPSTSDDSNKTPADKEAPWDIASDKKLIMLVKAVPGLYNSNNTLSCRERKDVWKEIGLKMGRVGAKCSVRWSSLKRQYRKHFFRLKYSKGRRTQYIYDNIISFVDPFLEKDNSDAQSNKWELMGGFESNKGTHGHDTNEEDVQVPGNIMVDGQIFKSEQYDEPEFEDYAIKTEVEEVTTQPEFADELSNYNFMDVKDSWQSDSVDIQESEIDEENVIIDNHFDSLAIDDFFSSMAETVKTFSIDDQQYIKNMLFTVVNEVKEKYICNQNMPKQDVYNAFNNESNSLMSSQVDNVEAPSYQTNEGGSNWMRLSSPMLKTMLATTQKSSSFTNKSIATASRSKLSKSKNVKASGLSSSNSINVKESGSSRSSAVICQNTGKQSTPLTFSTSAVPQRAQLLLLKTDLNPGLISKIHKGSDPLPIQTILPITNIQLSRHASLSKDSNSSQLPITISQNSQFSSSGDSTSSPCPLPSTISQNPLASPSVPDLEEKDPLSSGFSMNDYMNSSRIFASLKKPKSSLS